MGIGGISEPRLLACPVPTTKGSFRASNMKKKILNTHSNERRIPLSYISCRWSVAGCLTAWLVLPGLCCHGHCCGLLAVLWRWDISFPQTALLLGGGFGSSLSIAAAREEADSDEHHACSSPAVPETDETEQQAQVKQPATTVKHRQESRLVSTDGCACSRGSKHSSV